MYVKFAYFCHDVFVKMNSNLYSYPLNKKKKKKKIVMNICNILAVVNVMCASKMATLSDLH